MKESLSDGVERRGEGKWCASLGGVRAGRGHHLRRDDGGIERMNPRCPKHRFDGIFSKGFLPYACVHPNKVSLRPGGGQKLNKVHGVEIFFSPPHGLPPSPIQGPSHGSNAFFGQN